MAAHSFAVRLYVGGMVLCAFAALVSAGVLAEGLTLDRPWLFGVLAALVALENVLSVRLRKGDEGESRAHEEALLVFMILVLPPLAGLAAFCAGVVVGQLAVPRERIKAVFNIAQFTASAALAFTVAGVLAPGDGLSPGRVLGAILGVLAFSLANRAAVAGVIALTGASTFRDDFLEDLRPVAVTWAGAVSIGLLAGIEGGEHPWTLPFALTAWIALSVALSGHARARHDRQALSHLLESSAAAIFSVDRRGLIREWNPEMARITGRSSGEVRGRRLGDVVRARNSDGEAASDLLALAELAEPRERRFVRLATTTGDAGWVTLSRASLPDGGFTFVAQDITEQREAEQAVRESEERLRVALDAGAMGWWDWDAASGQVRWSENLERIYGLVPGTFAGTFDDFITRVHPDDRDFVLRTTERGLAEGRHELVHRIVWPDGSVRWLEGKGRVLEHSDGRTRGMSGVSFDVTERKQAETLAQLQARALERIAAGAPLVDVLELLTRLVEEHSGGELLASVLLLDEDGLHLRHGAAPSLPPAYTAAVDGIAIGPNVGSCGTAAYRRETVVVADIASDPLWEGARDLALAHGLRACWSTPIIPADGDVLGTFAMYYREPRAPSRADLQLAAVATHIAGVAIERARQEERLLSAETKYRRLVEQLPLAVYIDAPPEQGSPVVARTMYFSPQIEPMLGFAPSEFMTDPELFATLLHPDDRERVEAEVAHARRSGDRFSGHYRLVARDGRVVWIQDEAAYMRDEEGKIVGIEGYLVDVSERKVLESDLLQAQKMDAVGQLAGGVAHDFNNMMSAVVGFSELVLDRLEEGHALRWQIEEIRRAGERASEMTHQLLAFSRKQMLEPKVLDVNGVVGEAEKLLQRLIGENIDLVALLDPEVEPVVADRGQLEQVVMNLVVNARDAMPAGGKLTIETANVDLSDQYAASHVEVAAGHYVVVAVSDTGVGMDLETQARVFEPFFTTKEPGQGTGLGLATVFGIVKQSGGHVSVYSELGRGTTFKVYLPRADESSPSSHRGESDKQAPRGRETILLVEDEELVRNLGREALMGQGYTVLEAGSGSQALELADEHDGPIHLLLTDVVMPELSGPELADRLKPLRPETKVLFASGYADEAIVRHGVLDPDIAFLPKPVTPSSLARKVREVLDEIPEPSGVLR